MNQFLKRFTLLLGLLFVAVGSLYAASDKVSFTTEVPALVALGEPFRVEFRLNAKPDDDSFKAPDFEGFDVIAGPSVYRGSSVQFVNGSVTQTYEYTYTFVLLPTQEGSFSIGSAEVTVDKKSYQTAPTLLEVVKEQERAVSSAPASGQQQVAERKNPQNQVAPDDILLRVSTSRNEVYKGEPVRVAIKLYYRVSIAGLNNAKFPSFNGFWSQELDVENQPSHRENLNGKIYECSVLREFLLYPQQSGTLYIDPAEVEAVAQVVVQNNRHRDPFFGSTPDIYNVKRTVRSPKLQITVKELPAGAPSGFSGAVGRFTLSETAPNSQLQVNSAATFTLRIAGSGNLRFIQAPKLSLPASFEQYDIKTTEQLKNSPNGISGYRQFEYPFIARAEGEYELPPVEFSYFDPEKRQYVTLSSQPHPMVISPDQRGGSNETRVFKGISKEEVKLLNEEIRFIKSGDAHLQPKRPPFHLSRGYFLALGAILLLFVISFILLRKQIRESRNSVLVKGKRANKVAVQRFRSAKRAMTEQNRYAFYEEMSQALWGYMSDKLNIPVSNLTKENVREELLKRGISSEVAQCFTTIITRCEEAQYAPAASSQMSDIYKEGVELISHLESLIKKR